jgi:hypothetical protein
MAVELRFRTGANLTPENRRCRQSPADVTEGNKPKTSQRCDYLGVVGGEFGNLAAGWNANVGGTVW